MGIGMSFDWKMILLIWLMLGIASSIFVYWDMDRRKKMQGIWALLCIPLSVFGIVVYLAVRGKIKATGRELPPKPDYGKPEYRFKDEQKPMAEGPKEEVVHMEPSPPVKEVMPEPQKQEDPFPEPPSIEEPPVIKEEKPPQKMQIEGIPRCPKCGAAVSSFDAKCGDCGAKLK